MMLKSKPKWGAPKCQCIGGLRPCSLLMLCILHSVAGKLPQMWWAAPGVFIHSSSGNKHANPLAICTLPLCKRPYAWPTFSSTQRESQKRTTTKSTILTARQDTFQKYHSLYLLPEQSPKGLCIQPLQYFKIDNSISMHKFNQVDDPVKLCSLEISCAAELKTHHSNKTRNVTISVTIRYPDKWQWQTLLIIEGH